MQWYCDRSLDQEAHLYTLTSFLPPAGPCWPQQEQILWILCRLSLPICNQELSYCDCALTLGWHSFRFAPRFWGTGKSVSAFLTTMLPMSDMNTQDQKFFVCTCASIQWPIYQTLWWEIDHKNTAIVRRWQVWTRALSTVQHCKYQATLLSSVAQLSIAHVRKYFLVLMTRQKFSHYSYVLASRQRVGKPYNS